MEHKKRKIEVVKKDAIEKREIQKRRAALKLLRILIEENPEDAKRFVKGLPVKA